MNIILVGMPGAGKSTLGVLLAKALGMDYLDTDILIQQQTGRLLQEMIDSDGLEAFLAIEERIISGLTTDNCIIATGGSVVYSEKVMNTLRSGGSVVYLDVPYEEIEKRLKNIRTRGIVIKKGSSLRDVYDERAPLYIKYSDAVLECAHKDLESCVSELTEKIRGIMSENRPLH